MNKEKTPKEWLDKIEEERKKGNVCFLTYEGLMSMPLSNFIQQPAEGILYDLNRLSEVVAGWIEGDIKWVNDYAVGMTIKYLKEQNEILEKQLEIAIKLCDDMNNYYATKIDDFEKTLDNVMNIMYHARAEIANLEKINE